jgi:cell wall-associated NlpC family hydrolase
LRGLRHLTISRTVRRVAVLTAAGALSTTIGAVVVAAPASATVRGANPAHHTQLAAHRTALRRAHVLSTRGHRAVTIASYQRGKPYVWGAAGPHAFDCSGLVKFVYGRLGVHLPHLAQTQYTRTRHVSHAGARAGDLVFFALAGGGTHAIDHVGIYAGHHRMWVARHAGTRITREAIWTSRYWVGAVR